MVVAPFMGTALKFLFGTADNNDVIEIQRHIESLSETTEKTIHIAELQARGDRGIFSHFRQSEL